MGDERKKVMLNDPTTWPKHSHFLDYFVPECALCQIKVMAETSSPVVSETGVQQIVDQVKSVHQFEASHPQGERGRCYGRCNHEGTLHEKRPDCTDWVPDLSDPAQKLLDSLDKIDAAAKSDKPYLGIVKEVEHCRELLRDALASRIRK